MKRPPYRLLYTISELTFSSQVRNIVDLVSQLDSRMFRCEIGALRVGDPATGTVAALGVPYFRFRLIPTRRMNSGDYASLVASPAKLVAGGYDLVHSLLYQSVASEALAVKTLTGARYIYTKSNMDWDNHERQWHLKSRLSDCIVSISEATSELLRQRGFGGRAEKIHLGIDSDAFTLDPPKGHAFRRQWGVPEQAVVFGCVAQFIPLKEHLTLFRAFESVADAHPDAFLFVCGPNHGDAYYHSCVEYVRSSRHRGKIILVGTLGDMPAFYSAIDVFALPSRSETFGYAYVEAMSCERPAIGCRTGGPLEIIDDGRTGRHCRVSDAEDLAAAMAPYAANAEMRKSHGAAARKRVIELFSKQAMAQRTTELYLRLLQRA